MLFCLLILQVLTLVLAGRSVPQACGGVDDFRVKVSEFLLLDKRHVKPLLLMRVMPPSEDLLAMGRDISRLGTQLQCSAEAGVVLHLLRVFTVLAKQMLLHNFTSPQLSTVTGLWSAYNLYLEYHVRKAEVALRFGPLETWPLLLAEQLLGLHFRSLLLAVGPNTELVHTHCACRFAPETLTILFERFGQLRSGISSKGVQHTAAKFDFSFFQCESLQQVDIVFLLFLWQTSHSSQCVPSEVITRVACAQQALGRGESGVARVLMDAAVNLMVFAADCFSHTPWTGHVLSAGTVFHLWASFTMGRPEWTDAPGHRFAQEACSVELESLCVDVWRAELSMPAPGFLVHCGDSHGDWRRVGKRNGAPAPLSDRLAWVLRVTPSSLRNLWHLLHIILPAVHRLQRRQSSGGALPVDLLVDGVEDAALGILEGQFAWKFLRLLTFGEVVVLGDRGQPRHRCYRKAWWGHEAVTLFGSDKGALEYKDARVVIKHLTRSLAPSTATDILSGGARSASPRPWRLLFVDRREGRRALTNSPQVRQTLEGLRDQGLLRLAMVDFSTEFFSLKIAAQCQLAASADILLGPHGAGLAWSAFMKEGRVLIELMPHLRVLDFQLCPSEEWGATPMYAYGGVSLVCGIFHVCLIGAPLTGDPTSLYLEIGRWNSQTIRVDIEGLRRVLTRSLRHLEVSSVAMDDWTERHEHR